MGKSGTGQTNKKHKAGRKAGRSAREKHHDSKASVPDGNHRRSIKAGNTTGRNDRMHIAKQARDAKRAAVLAEKRAGVSGAPRVVAFISLSGGVDMARTRASFAAACAGERSADNEMGEAEAGGGGGGGGGGQQTMVARNHKLRLTLLPPMTDRNNPLEVVEVAKAADILILGLPAGLMLGGSGGDDPVDAAGQMALGVLRSLGAPTVVGVLQGLGDLAIKSRAGARKRAQEVLHGQVAGEPKLLPLDSSEDGALLLRHIAEVRAAGPQWRQHRPYVVVQGAHYEPGPAAAAGGEGAGGGLGTLLLRGYVRGAALSANQLVHVPGAGNFQIEAVQAPDDPCPLAPRKGGGGMDVDEAAAGPGGEPPVVAVPGPGQDSLVLENTPDLTAGEQTWPTEEELAEAEKGQRQRKKRRPKGMSEYQAAWIVDSEDEYSDAEWSDDEGGDAAMGGEDEGGDLQLDEEEEEEEDEELEEDVPDAEHLRAWKEVQAMREKEREEFEFPDEVDTPDDIEARRRFAKYRGLKSFRSTPWDPKELLPLEYARVFAFENFARTQRKAVAAPLEAQRDAESTMGGGGHGVAVGTYVQLRLKAVPEEAAAAVAQRLGMGDGPVTCSSAIFAEGGPRGSPLTAFGLLQHEGKLSVVHFAVTKHAGHEDPVRSKDELLYVTGVRAFTARGIFSSDAHGADKHKMERFLVPGAHMVSSIFGPISYSPLPVLAFRRDPEDPAKPAELVMVGQLRGCNPDRVMLKKIVLTGYPYKVHKKKAVVRFMFHNPEDVRFYKPLELFTKYGRRGKISEPIGTHGIFKSSFDNVISQKDTICAALFKRSFPPWPAALAPSMGGTSMVG